MTLYYMKIKASLNWELQNMGEITNLPLCLYAVTSSIQLSLEKWEYLFIYKSNGHKASGKIFLRVLAPTFMFLST